MDKILGHGFTKSHKHGTLANPLLKLMIQAYIWAKCLCKVLLPASKNLKIPSSEFTCIHLTFLDLHQIRQVFFFNGLVIITQRSLLDSYCSNQTVWQMIVLKSVCPLYSVQILPYFYTTLIRFSLQFLIYYNCFHLIVVHWLQF